MLARLKELDEGVGAVFEPSLIAGRSAICARHLARGGAQHVLAQRRLAHRKGRRRQVDDRLRAGGVGFFSEAGEHARLYWVKVSNNTDWLGRLCGMLSGGTQQNSAGLGLRGDIVARQASMKANLSRAEEAIQHGDIARTKKYLDLAGSDVEVFRGA